MSTPTSSITPSAPTSSRIGLIYSPKPGSERRWRKLLRHFEQRQALFDYVRAENSADVQRLSAMMTRNGYTIIVVAGGDAALNYAINGIMNTPSPTGGHPRLGIIPMGFANDFASFWGLTSGGYRHAADSVIAGRTRRVDVGRARIETIEKENVQPLYFINCVNIGVAASILNLKHLTHSFLGLRTLAHLTSAFLLLFQRMTFGMTMTTGGDSTERRAMTLCIGSARGYGQTPSAVPYNGLLDASLVPPRGVSQILHGLFLLFTGRFLSHKGIGVWRSRRFDISLADRAGFSVDGRFCPLHAQHLHIDILPEEIAFIIP